MSIPAINWAYAQDLKPGPKYMLVTLANYTNANLQCWPSIQALRRQTGYSNKAVVSNLRKLLEKGLIIKRVRGITQGQIGGRKSTMYTLNIPESEKTTLSGAKVNFCPTQSVETTHYPKENQYIKNIYIHPTGRRMTQKEEIEREIYGWDD